MNSSNGGPTPKRMKFSQNGDDHYTKVREERLQLPIRPARNRLIHQVQKHNSVIIIGETGSGKTTQIPQFLYEAGLHRNSVIAITQPRTVAAITVSQRVALEKRSDMGDLVIKHVGYRVRFDDTTSERTKIKYMTDGMLLREAISDPLMKRYSIVILDEAHERTIHTDVLFGVVKSAQHQRQEQGMKPLKIIVMSATMDVDHFSKYFNKAPVLYLEGRQFPITVMYTKEEQSDYLFASLVTLFQIHREALPQEDILIFLTGQEEIESAVKSIRDIARNMTGNVPNMLVCPLYAALPSQQQLKVFQPTPKGCRKVIVATNIAETSITVHGIKYVIDSGKVKAKIYNSRGGLDLMKVVHVSQAQAQQRCGRAGRESPGTCYRLYTEQQYEALRKTTVPEIQRCNLASVVLQLTAMGIQDVVNFDFMDKPSSEAILNAIEQLKLLGALENTEEIKLTQTGKQMAEFPLDPRMSKVILSAKHYKCLEEILTIVSLLSVDSVLYTPQSKREHAVAVRQKFMSSEGDHITLLNVFRAYKGVNGNKQWCQENFINMRNMRTVFDVRRQLRDICVRQDLPLNTCGHDTTSIRKCLATGYFMNSAELQKEGEYMSLSTRKTVTIHPSSALFHCKPAYVIYNELVQTTKCYMRDLCVVDADWLYDTAPTYFKKKKPGG
ncbi:ATP-dependent RNA helicase DHX33-like isoform X1 [Ruditapes philippinarum]|uniref:ATP-dependent RNA helicase DHX33-like isoform X1 n=1 Tax=Ruditapes philippinarum TaxID=129788 RepID=UPI00295BDF42|nr:ATP-dependent RNA helicase DHX33-like isoform X1 [Ruditapes philippinarum]